MCGIVGSIGGHRQLSDAITAIGHRGPDSHGDATFDLNGTTVRLGHTRLAILDLSAAGHQPMWSRDRRWCITFNGEVYNHNELRKNLSGPFRGHSDTETLVEYLAQHGIRELLGRMNGMFAFAAVDTQTGHLYLVRDPFGIKPLYFVDDATADGTDAPRFAFSSEVRALKALGCVSPQLDREALHTLLTLRYVPSPATLWQDVRRLPPGHVLDLDLATARSTIDCYVRPVADRFHGSQQDAVAAYRQVLQGAIDRQLLSDVPVGLLLSGGIDSALIAALAKDSGHRLSTYTVGFGAGRTECEIDDAAHTAQVLGLENRAVQVSADDLRAAFTQAVAQIEEPLGTVSILPMWYLTKLAREDVKVVLTGQGSDEPWGGYRRYQMEILRNRIPLQPFWSLTRLLQNNPRVRRAPEFVRRALHAAHRSDRTERYLAIYEQFSQQERQALLRSTSNGQATKSIQYWLDWLADTRLERAEPMLRIDTRMNLADDLLLYGDKISMAYALEARVPMLDNEVVAFIESLPLSYRVGLAKTKIVHRALAETYLPGAIVHRPKKGFQVPFGHWLRNEWRDWAESLMFDAGSRLDDVFARDEVRKIWEQHLRGDMDRSTQLFMLLAMQVWLEHCR